MTTVEGYYYIFVLVANFFVISIALETEYFIVSPVMPNVFGFSYLKACPLIYHHHETYSAMTIKKEEARRKKSSQNIAQNQSIFIQ